MSDTVAGSVPLDSPLGRIVIVTTVAGSAVAMLTATVVNVALPVLARDLDASSSQQQWVVNAYLLTIASMILIGGSLGDRYGRLKLYRLGIVWFAAASAACALAPNVEVLIVARLFQGVGGALLTPGSLAIIESTLRHEDRGRGVGKWSGLGGVAGAIGPLVGGLLVDISWRWVFLLNLPVALLVLSLAGRLPESKDPAAREAKLDVVGAALTAVALGGASYALIQGRVGGFGALDTAAAVASVMAVVGLLWFEPRQPQAIVPFDLFANRRFTAANIVTFLVYGGMGVVFFLLSIQLQVSVGWSPLAAGAALLPITLLMLMLSARAGDLAQRIGPRLPLTAGPAMIAVAMVLLSRVDAGDAYLTGVLPAVLVFGCGLALSVAPVTATALGSVPDDRAGAASGTNNALARTGQLLAIAAIPPLVGLTNDALSDPDQLTAGFSDAMLVGSAFVAMGAIVAAVLFRNDDLRAPAGPVVETGETTTPEGPIYQCGVDGPTTPTGRTSR